MIDSFEKRFFSDKNFVWFFLFAIIILLLPVFLRELSGNESLIGQMSYFHLGLAQNTALAPEHQYPLNNGFINGFHYFLWFFISFLGVSFASKFVPFFLGVLALWLVRVLSNERFLHGIERIVFFIILIISPVFISSFSTLNPYSLVFVLALASFLLFIRNNFFFLFFSLLIVFVDYRAFFVFSLLLFAYGFLHKMSFVALINLLLGSLLVLFLKLWFGFLAFNPDFVNPSISGFFSVLGANFGYSVFIIILSIIGLGVVWSKNLRSVFVSLVFFLVFLSSWFWVFARVLFLPVVSVLAAKALTSFIKRNWVVDKIKSFTLFIVFLSFLFVLLFSVSDLVSSPPSPEQIVAFKFLQTSPRSSVVLSSPENSVFIERIGRRSAFVDFTDLGSDSEKLVVLNELWYGFDYSRLSSLLHRFNISLILVDKNMVNGGVWDFDEEGLLFFLKNDDRFVPVFSSDYCTIYRFVG